MTMETVSDTDRIEPSSKQNSNGGFLGKFINKTWNTVKSGVGKASKFVGDSTVGKAGKWVWKNKAPILNTIGGAAQGFGAITANPTAIGIGKGLSTLASGIREGEVKAALQKTIAERQPNPLGSNIGYEDFPRIHYSRKPTAYKIYQNRSKYVDEAEAHIARTKQRRRKKSRKSKK